LKSQFRLPGGDFEYAVLAKLWELGSASARDIYTQVGEPQGLVYTTTAKVLDRLYVKRLISVSAGEWRSSIVHARSGR
jgi:predicted transcriptional regulator